MKNAEALEILEALLEITRGNVHDAIEAAVKVMQVQKVGKCKECINSPDMGTRTKGMRWCRNFKSEVNPNGFCNCFYPREGETYQ